MSMRVGHFKEFTPPLAAPLGGGLELLVERAGLDRTGEAVINALIKRENLPLQHPGAVLHKDRVLLGTARDRQRFVRQATDAAPDLEPSRLAAALLKFALALPGLLAGEGTAGTQRDAAMLWEQARSLAEAPDLLEQVTRMIQAHGIVGEERHGLLLYLSATARLGQRPVSVLVKGASGSGKDELMFAVLGLLPQDAYLSYSSITARYLIHSTADLRHRILVLAEASGIARGDGAYIVRTLLSEGRLRYGTSAGGGQEITKEGPTTLWTSTILTHLDPELETRALSLSMRDDEVQNRAVMERMAGTYSDQRAVSPDPSASQALQEWLALTGERHVHIPYARVLARQIRHATEVGGRVVVDQKVCLSPGRPLRGAKWCDKYGYYSTISPPTPRDTGQSGPVSVAIASLSQQ